MAFRSARSHTSGSISWLSEMEHFHLHHLHDRFLPSDPHRQRCRCQHSAGRCDQDRQTCEITLKAAYAIVEAGLIIQSLFLLAFMALVFRWRYVTQHWEVEWDPVRRMKMDLEGPSNERPSSALPFSW